MFTSYLKKVIRLRNPSLY